MDVGTPLEGQAGYYESNMDPSQLDMGLPAPPMNMQNQNANNNRLGYELEEESAVGQKHTTFGVMT